MADTFDLLITGATIVNHDGAGERDIGIRGGRWGRSRGQQPPK